MTASKPYSIYILSTGRSGTSVFAKACSGHPNLVVRSVFPYEERASQHLFTWAENGRDKNFPYISKDRESKASYRLYQRDDLVSKSWFDDNMDILLKHRAIDAASQYYAYVADYEGKNNPEAYLEKAIGAATVIRMHRWGWPLKVVFLIRDPRDILLSVNSYNKKNDIKGFGADKFDDRELLKRYISFYRNLQSSIKEHGMKGVEVKYESLLADPFVELKKVAVELAIDSSDKAITGMVDTYSSVDNSVKAHRTQKNTNIISRWRSEATEEQLRIFSGFKEELSELGYSS